MSDSTELINKINSLIKKHSDEIARFEAEKNTTQNVLYTIIYKMFITQ